jgi:hypothetical protein
MPETGAMKYVVHHEAKQTALSRQISIKSTYNVHRETMVDMDEY